MPIDRGIYGAGGHAKVVIDALRRGNPKQSLEVWDDNPDLGGNKLMELSVRAPVANPLELPSEIHVAIGNNPIRQRVSEKLLSIGKRLFTVIHPSASVASSALVGDGSFVAAMAVVAPDARIVQGVIVNHGAVVDHDCMIDAYAHIAPRATLGGGVSIGAGCLIGAGAVVLPGLTVGEGALIGAGAVVTHDVAARATLFGVPARAREQS